MLTATLLGACSSGGGNSRTIEVDNEYDEFAGTFRAFFPRDVTVKPGMTLKFHQKWSGEPHTVTMGTEVQDRIEPEMLPIVRESTSRDPAEDEDFGPAVDAALEAFFGELPFFFGEKGPNPPVAQACYLDDGLPTGDKACPKNADTEFDGDESYFNSGFIPYEGTSGNEFEMKIADDAKPGKYFYYCALHGPGMSGQIEITKSGSIPSQASMNKQAQKEIAEIAEPMLTNLESERKGNSGFEGNLAGSGGQLLEGIKGQVNEFTPRTVQAKINEPVKWTFISGHTISFNVPPYFPLYDVKSNGVVTENPKAYEPAGSFSGRPEPTADEGPPVPRADVDAGKFDGSGGLQSSGADWQTGDTYSVTFTKAGTYPMACLIHPGMIGKVVVS
jgi:plastocyanin